MLKQDVMKHDPKEKRHRNALLIEYHASHPDIPIVEKAKIFRITRQRFYAILKTRTP